MGDRRHQPPRAALAGLNAAASQRIAMGHAHRIERNYLRTIAERRKLVQTGGIRDGRLPIAQVKTNTGRRLVSVVKLSVAVRVDEHPAENDLAGREDTSGNVDDGAGGRGFSAFAGGE